MVALIGQVTAGGCPQGYLKIEQSVPEGNGSSCSQGRKDKELSEW